MLTTPLTPPPTKIRPPVHQKDSLVLPIKQRTKRREKATKIATVETQCCKNADQLYAQLQYDMACFTLAEFSLKGIALQVLKRWQQRVSLVLFPWSLMGAYNYNTERLNANRRFQFFPSMIVKAHTNRDVARTLHFARNAGTQPISVVARSGRHSAEGFSLSSSIVLDQGERTSFSVLALTTTCTSRHRLPVGAHAIVTVRSGVLLGPLADQLWRKHRLFVPAGSCPNVALAGGLAFAGGIGFSSRARGLTCDSMVGVTILLSNGSQILRLGTHSRRAQHTTLVHKPKSKRTHKKEEKEEDKEEGDERENKEKGNDRQDKLYVINTKVRDMHVSVRTEDNILRALRGIGSAMNFGIVVSTSFAAYTTHNVTVFEIVYPYEALADLLLLFVEATPYLPHTFGMEFNLMSIRDHA